MIVYICKGINNESKMVFYDPNSDNINHGGFVTKDNEKIPTKICLVRFKETEEYSDKTLNKISKDLQFDDEGNPSLPGVELEILESEIV